MRVIYQPGNSGYKFPLKFELLKGLATCTRKLHIIVHPWKVLRGFGTRVIFRALADLMVNATQDSLSTSQQGLSLWMASDKAGMGRGRV